FSLGIQLALSLAIAFGILAYLLWFSGGASPEKDERPSRAEEIVSVVGPRSLQVRAGTPLDKQFREATQRVREAELTAPVLHVTGTVLASLRPGREESLDASVPALLASPLGTGPLLAASLSVSARMQSKDAWQFATPELLTTFADWEKAVLDVRFQEAQ